ncbi:MAG: hypothetical protein M3N19_07365 [Candidatus Eremiobacteraeota bacterium]|nr:hypothetical protein [Candidatus Eremiobacteraeota bacterium]
MLTVVYLRGYGLKRAGANRSLAALIARLDPQVFGVCEIDAGDALAIATRFAMQWGYRGGQAVFWKPRFTALTIRDEYLPFSAARPFERRGLLRIALRNEREHIKMVATQIGSERDVRIRELRHLRNALREERDPCVVFSILPPGRIGLEDLGFKRAGCLGVDNEAIYTRGFAIKEAYDDNHTHPGLGTPIVAGLRIIPKG